MSDDIRHLFNRVATKMPTAVAVEFGARRITYGELQSDVQKLAGCLSAAGISRGNIVGIFSNDVIEVITGILATLEAGGIFCPLDPTFPERRLETMLSVVPPQFMLAKEDLFHVVRRLTAAAAQKPEFVPTNSVGGQVRSLPATDIDLRPGSMVLGHSTLGPEDACSVYFTSGTTGKPKAIVGRLKGIDHFVRWEIEALGVKEGTKVSQLASPSFDGFLKDVFVGLCAGGVVSAPETRKVVQEAGRLIDWVDVEGIEVLHCVPSVLRAMLNEGLEERYFGSLRWVVLAGEALGTGDVKRWKEVFGERIGLVNLYGPTETTITKLYYFVQAGDEQRPSIPIGRPIPGATTLVVNSQGALCKPGMVGEIWIRTPYRALGYYGEPELTREVFVQNPFSQEKDDLVYRTGDYGRLLEDGNLEFVGRRDQQVKVRGVRVELGEIENLLRSCVGVKDAAVVDREDGNGIGYLCAYVVLEAGRARGEVREELGRSLPEYMMPVGWVEMRELPRTLNGKIDRKGLPSVQEARGGRKHGEGEAEGSRVGSGTAVEEIVSGIWSEVLRVEEVGREENFFELGGHSLLATQIISRVREALKVELPLRVLFEAPTVSALSRRIEKEIGVGGQKQEERIPVVSREEGPLPLSYAQQRMWVLEQFNPTSSAYHIQTAVRLLGRMNIGALEQTLGEIIRRHEVLRTRFVVREGEPRQEVVAAGQTRLQLVELGGLEAREREEEARRMAVEEAGKPFDLSRGPLLRMVLLRLEEEQHILLCTMHHIICDGWSKGILIHEITAIYQAFICGGRLPLAEMPIQYADYAAWQRNYLRAETAREDLDYWKSQLAQAPPLLQMPADRPRPAVQTYAGGRENLRLPKKLFEDLKALSRKSGVTLFMMLLAAFKALVFRYTAQEDIVLGTSVAGRNKRETEDLIGFFVNMLVLRTRCSGNSTFQEILDRVRDDSLHAFAHQSVPFEMLVETLQPERNLSYSPLFQVLFSLQNAPASELCLPGLSLGFPELQTVAAKYDLLVDLWQDKDQLTCALEYNSDLFESASVRRLLLHYQRILESIVQSPERRIHELPLMSELELHEVIVERNRQQASYPADACVHELFEQAVKKYPERIALILRDEGLTYRELNSRANKTARYLQALGEGPGSLVGIYTEHSFAELIGILAVLKIGAGYVPFPPGIHREKLQSAIADASVRVILTAKKFFDSLEGLKVTPVCLDQERHAMESLNDHNLGIPASKEFIAYVIYTSGSTGEPKGVAVSHRALVNYLWWAKDAYKIDDYAGWALYSSIAFDLTVTSLYAALIQGAPLIIHSLSEEEPPLEKMLSNDRIGVLKVTPSHLLLMKDHEWARSATRCLVVGGEALSTKVAREIHNAFAGDVQIFNEYGPTEATVGCMIHRFDENSDRQFVPIGRAIPNMQIYVLDQFLNPVPENVVGELFVAGDGLAAGYVNRPEFTAERFLPNPFLSGHRMYRTGDLAKWLPEGEVEFLGRIDDQVKVRGFRVELGEVETVLSKHPKVRECALLLQEDVKGTRYLTACYVPQLTGALEDTELRRFMQERLPFYMVPGVYVEMDTLPKSRSGKVDRRALSANCTPGLAATKTYVAPSTPIEKAIAEIWASVLGVQKPGAQDNFFQLGGHSIMAIQITQRINQNFPVNLSMRTIFREPTIAGLAIVVEEMILDQLEFKAS